MSRKQIRKARTFFSEKEREEKVSSLRNTLDRLDLLISWEDFRPLLERIRKPSPKGGRPPYDEIFMFKCLVLQEMYGLSDEEVEYQIADRCSFQKFLGMDITSDVPDHSTINNFRNLLKDHGLVNELFDVFNRRLAERGLVLQSGVIADATFVETPRRRCSKEESQQIKDGLPAAEVFPDKSAQSCSHRDVDARWAVKNDVRHFGYKDHVLCDSETKFIVDYEVTSANVHDSQMLLSLLPLHTTEGQSVYADSAYDSSALHEELRRRGFTPEIIKKGRRNHPLTPEQETENKRKSHVRCRIEHIFGDIKNRRAGLMIRTIGLDRARTKIGLINLVYNMRRLLTISLQNQKKREVLWG